MLMSKNVNNDVSKDSPIQAPVGSHFEIALKHKIKHEDNIVRGIYLKQKQKEHISL